MLTEIAPGVDLERDVLGMMDFRPLISENLKTIDPVVYQDGKIGLKELFKTRQ